MLTGKTFPPRMFLTGNFNAAVTFTRDSHGPLMNGLSRENRTVLRFIAAETVSTMICTPAAVVFSPLMSRSINRTVYSCRINRMCPNALSWAVRQAVFTGQCIRQVSQVVGVGIKRKRRAKCRIPFIRWVRFGKRSLWL